MAIILGIDTGGTYTDGVIIDNNSKQIICKSKALTTREDLALGIRNCIHALDRKYLENLSMVTLSTTLATNTIVEGRGSEVGVIMIGHEPLDNLPTKHVIVIPGRYNTQGIPIENLDLEYLKQNLEKFRNNVEAIAISGYLSVRNPAHELEVRNFVREVLKLPTVCAHELTTKLGLYERTVTAVLNARLIPVIADLLKAVKIVLSEKDIKAPLMIVKGDASLISEQMALEKPIETILSGPAASIIGATFLTPLEKALVVDMGGTTTDIALVEKGIPRLTNEGAIVGGWSTRVRSAEIHTYGLGGDSYLKISKDGKFSVGPQRVIPFCRIAIEYPSLKQEFLQYNEQLDDIFIVQSMDCYISLPRRGDIKLTSMEKEIVSQLESGPHSYLYLAEKMNIHPYLFQYNFDAERLVNLGLISRISLTPTDILHAQGIYTTWDREAAIILCQHYARRLGLTNKEFLEMAYKTIVDQLSLAMVQSIQMYDGESGMMEHVKYYLDKAFHPKAEALLSCKLEFGIPIIGIGAPIEAWLPRALVQLSAPPIVPKYADVANAVGAAVGKIMITREILIKPGENFNYIVHSVQGCYSFRSLHKAIAFAENEAKELAVIEAKKVGANTFELFLEHNDIYAPDARRTQHFIESKVKVTAVGSLKWL